MAHRIFLCKTKHKRIHPIQNEFEYPLYMMQFNLSDTKLNTQSLLLSINSFNVFSLNQADYLIDKNTSILEKFNELIKQFKIKENYDELHLLTTPRFFTKTFNPVCFYYAYNLNKLQFIVAEVTNTFKEKHMYFLPIREAEIKSESYHFKKPKNFYISPFSSDDGELSFNLSDIKKNLKIIIHYSKNNRKEMIATLSGTAKPLNSKNLIKLAFSYPLSAAKTMPRILYQAAKIHYLKKHKARRKPMATNTLTIKKDKKPKFITAYINQFKTILKQINGSIEIHFPSGEVELFGNQSRETVVLSIHSYNFFNKIVESADIGLAESYMKGEWTCSNLPELLAQFIANKPLFTAYKGNPLVQSVLKLKHKLRHNSVANSKKNIADHYDLGNAFYKLFLDETMTYSCAYFPKPNTTLADAQRSKMAKIIDKLQIEPGMTVLEIGSGWGSMAIELAKKGCKVHTLTLSEEQFNYAKVRFEEEKLNHLIQIDLQDYRQHQGKYDRVVSIEMIEAVGHDYLSIYFEHINNFLKDDGLAVIQAITMPDKHYAEYIKKTDFIQQYIFPGAHLPSIGHMSEIVSTKTELVLDNLESIGQHYAVTLNRWRNDFLKNYKTIKDMYDSQFVLMWDMYFSYCEAGFKERYINAVQMVLTKPQNVYLINEFNKAYY